MIIVSNARIEGGYITIDPEYEQFIGCMFRVTSFSPIDKEIKTPIFLACYFEECDVTNVPMTAFSLCNFIPNVYMSGEWLAMRSPRKQLLAYRLIGRSRPCSDLRQ